MALRHLRLVIQHVLNAFILRTPSICPTLRSVVGWVNRLLGCSVGCCRHLRRSMVCRCLWMDPLIGSARRGACRPMELAAPMPLTSFHYDVHLQHDIGARAEYNTYLCRQPNPIATLECALYKIFFIIFRYLCRQHFKSYLL